MNLHLVWNPKITTRAAYLIHRLQVPLAFTSLQLCLLSPGWQRIFFPRGSWRPGCIPPVLGLFPLGLPLMSTIPVPLPKGLNHQSATFFLINFTDNPDHLQPVCPLMVSQMLHTLPIFQICLGSFYLPRLHLLLKTLMAHIFLIGSNDV